MKAFLLDSNPTFGESKVTVDDFEYVLKNVKGNGCYLTIVGKVDGLERDHIAFTRSDLRALFLLLCTEKK
jgi:hypothetical protein